MAYYLPCVACGFDLSPSRPEPRIPLCRLCQKRRTTVAAKAAAEKRRAEAS